MGRPAMVVCRQARGCKPVSRPDPHLCADESLDRLRAQRTVLTQMAPLSDHRSRARHTEPTK
ncbi:hypothetical protein HLASF_1697 [Halanaeroarchaeum sulfurireducens]|uniref:Uncharacterized protein n=1 Tax=Halanaeroarchaeum sulfurireducens TaxID=1604004 RepID=A0A0F7PFW7_9EURY|nr:hypothetical protein HLASF_1697 [Halanaeroarchaeum sulfurireducens]ALG82567.1 hypothetical protein HLASA_1684 [Halanaeroarchaeum sulfurireducens]